MVKALRQRKKNVEMKGKRGKRFRESILEKMEQH